MPVQTGEVRVPKDVVTEKRTLHVPVEREEVVVERRPVPRRRVSNSLPGTYTVGVSIMDHGVTVASTTTTALSGLFTEGVLNFSIGFNDTDTAESSEPPPIDYTALIQWGDGASDAGILSNGPGAGDFVVTGAHRYTPGHYNNVTVTITDTPGTSITHTEETPACSPVPPLGSSPFFFTPRSPPKHSLTAYNSSAGAESLHAAIMWWPIAMVLALAYAGFVFRHYRGKVTDAAGSQGRY